MEVRAENEMHHSEIIGLPLKKGKKAIETLYQEDQNTNFAKTLLKKAK